MARGENSAVSPHPCDLSPIFQGPVTGNCSVFSALSHSWPPPFLCSFSVHQVQASCNPWVLVPPSTVLHRIHSSEQSSRWTFSSHFTEERLSQGHAATVRGRTRAQAPGSRAGLWHLVYPFASCLRTGTVARSPVSPQHRCPITISCLVICCCRWFLRPGYRWGGRLARGPRSKGLCSRSGGWGGVGGEKEAVVTPPQKL